MPTAKIKFATAYENKRQSKKFIEGASMTKQAFKRECDINHIMAKYQKTGLIDHVNVHQGDYSDLTDVPTYHDAMNKVISANESFATLPSNIRKQFNNNPAEFLDFVSNPDNQDAMRQMGLLPSLPPQPDLNPVEDTEPVVPVE